MRRIALINGPNLNLLGRRKVQIYGSTSLKEIEQASADVARRFGYRLWAVQSNSEGELVELIHKASDSCVGIIINAGAYTHTSIAIHDALENATIPVVEVHLSNIYAREKFRHKSYVSPVASGIIAGLGLLGYGLAVEAIADLVGKTGTKAGEGRRTRSRTSIRSRLTKNSKRSPSRKRRR